ncbi:hypothetical protein VTL71DRAFT_6925 [Oculimacula yallundae]|uniref:STEEP1 domain-containing protein n=1 Tax=Oculimacula yallundae TaxID=86028 RepID=A0ABR4BVA6_9HELO
MAPPKIQTYHCLCSTLLFASTHTLSSLPRRQAETNTDGAIILPLPSTPPSPLPFSASERELQLQLPAEGYTTLLSHSLIPDKKQSLIRRDEGFEKRVLWRCLRCRLVIGYELSSSSTPTPTQAQTQAQTREVDSMDIDSSHGIGNGKGKEKEVFEGKVLYILPGGVMSSEYMMGGKKIGEGDVEISFSGGGGRGVAVFE